MEIWWMGKEGVNPCCWKCGKPLEIQEKIPFRATCPHCHAYLHSCKNCKNYSPGLPNDCKIPGTDPISDREAGNYCDEFTPLNQLKEKPSQKKDPFQKLFKFD